MCSDTEVSNEKIQSRVKRKIRNMNGEIHKKPF